MPRVVVLGLVRDGDVYDAIVEDGRMVLARIGAARRRAPRWGGLLTALNWAAVLYSKIGLRRLSAADGDALVGEDESAARERLRLATMTIDGIAARDPRNVAIDAWSAQARAIGGDAPLIELSSPCLEQPLLLLADGDPPERLMRALAASR